MYTYPQFRKAGGEFLAAASRCFLVRTNSCNLALTSEEATAPLKDNA
jgi:hypothetical protein